MNEKLKATDKTIVNRKENRYSFRIRLKSINKT
jgi:hypothetical protein